MPRPEFTKTQAKLDSDALIVRPYWIWIVGVGGSSALLIGVVLLFVESTVMVGAGVAAIVLLATQIVGYLLILAKQVEAVHRMNSRLDELLRSSGLEEYVAGQAQGRADTLREIDEQRPGDYHRE